MHRKRLASASSALQAIMSCLQVNLQIFLTISSIWSFTVCEIHVCIITCRWWVWQLLLVKYICLTSIFKKNNISCLYLCRG